VKHATYPYSVPWLGIQRRDGDKGMIVYITNENHELVKKITMCHDKEMGYKWEKFLFM